MLPFRQVDVFSAEPWLGNPLAVVHDADGLTDEQMARFARWTNLSETTFLSAPADPAADYRVRIWTTTGELPFARVVVSDGGREKRAEARGDGIVDATFKAIESIAQSGADLLLFSVNNVTEGTDSQGEVTVRLSKGGRIVNGMGADTDIVVASAKAYVNALNKLGAKTRVNPQYDTEAHAL